MFRSHNLSFFTISDLIAALSKLNPNAAPVFIDRNMNWHIIRNARGLRIKKKDFIENSDLCYVGNCVLLEE